MTAEKPSTTQKPGAVDYATERVKVSKKLDPRVKRTRAMLREALIELIAERGFDNLSVQDIASRAILNRATFYLHYRDKYDLLTRSMDDVYEELIAAQAAPEAGNRDMALSNMTLLFTHTSENAAFYRVMLSADAPGAFRARIETLLAGLIQHRIDQLTGGEPAMPRELTIRYIAAAHVGALIWWLEMGMPHPPAVMAEYLLRLTLSGPYRALGFDPDPLGFT
jgi:AcrR family transcriptional regulator